MRIFKQLFYITLLVGIISLLIYIFGDEDSKYTRIFMGLFTGSTLGCITALIHYLGARKQFLEDRYKIVTQMAINLYEIKSLLIDIESSYKNIELNYDILLNLDSKITTISAQTVKFNSKAFDHELIGYIPLFGRNKINGILYKLQLSCHKNSNILFKNFNRFNVSYLEFLRDAKPIMVNDTDKGIVNINYYAYKTYFNYFPKDIETFKNTVDAIIEIISIYMKKIDKVQNVVERKWENIEEILLRIIN